MYHSERQAYALLRLIRDVVATGAATTYALLGARLRVSRCAETVRRIVRWLADRGMVTATSRGRAGMAFVVHEAAPATVELEARHEAELKRHAARRAARRRARALWHAQQAFDWSTRAGVKTCPRRTEITTNPPRIPPRVSATSFSRSPFTNPRTIVPMDRGVGRLAPRAHARGGFDVFARLAADMGRPVDPLAGLSPAARLWLGVVEALAGRVGIGGAIETPALRAACAVAASLRAAATPAERAAREAAARQAWAVPVDVAMGVLGTGDVGAALWFRGELARLRALDCTATTGAGGAR